jgi:hypothetical protein
MDYFIYIFICLNSYPYSLSDKIFYLYKNMNKVVLTTALIALLVVAVYMTYTCSDVTKEGFWMLPSRQVKVEKMFKDSNDDFFQVANFQGILSPRFSNVDYGANLRTKFPNYNTMGVPQDPLQQKANPPDPLDYAIAEGIPASPRSTPLVEGYKGANPQYGWQESKSLGSGGIPLDPHNPYSADYTAGDYNQVVNMAVGAGAVNGWPTDTIAELDQASFMTQDGEMVQPIVYDRFIYANRNSRLRGQGDPIRGDLPITPMTGNWMIPRDSFNPNQVLQQGAINVMAGVNNETSNSLANLIYNTSGGTETTIGGVDMTQMNMSHQVYGAASAAQGDIQVTSFP